MKVHHQEEYNIPLTQFAAINTLLQTCFPGYPSDRNYYKSIPTFRLMIWDKKILIGHLAVVFRVVKVGSTTSRIFGISDVCVHPEYRSKKIASILLDKLEEEAQKNSIDFSILIAQEQSLYKKRGYKSVTNTVRWLLINDHQSLGVMHGTLDKSLMVKTTGEIKWNGGLLDLIGGVF